MIPYSELFISTNPLPWCVYGLELENVDTSLYRMSIRYVIYGQDLTEY